ncbi:hypothetical protein [Williamsia herbipolensis]|uniref:hypothetical protein n=1 Tax=Williamsia herbipolensis TaxID=1603258 RepID=UPI0005F81DDC|nr:hypothetical protein [Williamsia herbipolensis]
MHPPATPEYFHVSSSVNRASITEHGLDVARMGAARGIAGSREPEEHGCFVACGAFERDWFVRMNNTGGPVDVWRIHPLDPDRLVTHRHGHRYVPGAISVDQISLHESDIPPYVRH